MKLLRFIWFVIVCFLPHDTNGQNNIFASFQVGRKVPLEMYCKRDKANYEEITLPEIKGLSFINDKYCYWVNQQGLVTIWDIYNNIFIHNCLLEKSAVFNSFYSPKINSFVFNSFVENSKIDIMEASNDCRILSTLKNDLSLTYRTICISPNADKIVAIRDSLIFVWTKIGSNWELKKNVTTEHFFEVNFLNDKTLLIGCDNGIVIYYDILTFEVKKKIKAHNSTVAIINVSESKNRFATTDGKDVRIWQEGKPNILIQPNIDLVDAMQWLDNDIIVVAGSYNAIEIWSVKDIASKKLLQSFNTEGQQRKQKKDVIILPTGKSYLFVKDSTAIDSLKLSAKVKALGSNDNNFISVGYETFDVEVYKYIKQIDFLSKKNVYEKIAKSGEQNIRDIEIDNTGVNVYVGLENGFISNHYFDGNWGAFLTSMPYSDINSKSFGDILLVHHKESKTYRSGLTWVRNLKKGEVGKSELFREIQRILSKNQKQTSERYFPNFKFLKDPSGFEVSNNKKYIVQYDSSGLLQVLQVSGLKLIVDNNLKISLKKVLFNNNSDKLWLITFDNKIYSCDFLQKGVNITQTATIAVSFDNIASNDRNLLALYSSNDIFIYDINNHNIVDKVSNNKKNFSIHKVEFMGHSNRFLWILNENTSPKILEKKESKSHIDDYGSIKQISVSNDKKTILFGNTLGEILSLKR